MSSLCAIVKKLDQAWRKKGEEKFIFLKLLREGDDDDDCFYYYKK